MADFDSTHFKQAKPNSDVLYIFSLAFVEFTHCLTRTKSEIYFKQSSCKTDRQQKPDKNVEKFMMQEKGEVNISSLCFLYSKSLVEYIWRRKFKLKEMV